MNGTHVEPGATEGVDLQQIDVNLLVAFDALAAERNVTRAAGRLGVTQSAMSHTLRRLRALLDDPVLVRGRGGMVLTPRAEALVVPLRAGLVTLARALAGPATFDPATSRRRFTLVGPDLFDVLALPGLLRRLGVEAPGIDLAVVARPARLPDALETGEVDLAIEPVLLDDEPFDRRLDGAPDLRRRSLLRDTMRCFVRRGHPLAGRKRLSARAYAAAAHVLVSPSGEGPGVVDRYLAREGLERRVALRVPLFASALSVVAASDLVLTAPRVLGQCPMAADLVGMAPPLSLPAHAITMVWHPRFTEDPAHRWLRECVATVTRAVGRPTP